MPLPAFSGTNAPLYLARITLRSWIRRELVEGGGAVEGYMEVEYCGCRGDRAALGRRQPVGLEFRLVQGNHRDGRVGGDFVFFQYLSLLL